MPANCSADVQAVIAHVDSILATNDSTQITSLKKTFGLQGLGHNDDFAAGRKSQDLLRIVCQLEGSLIVVQCSKPSSGGKTYSQTAAPTLSSTSSVMRWR